MKMNVWILMSMLTCFGVGSTSSRVQIDHKTVSDMVNTMNDINVFNAFDTQDLVNSSDNNTIIVKACRAFLVEYAKESSQFTKCLVENARPFRFCETCVIPYKKASSVFSDMIDDSSCSQELLMADRVQVVRLVHTNMENIWKSAYCKDCFSSITEDVNGTVNTTLTNNTMHFFHLFENMTACLNYTLQDFEANGNTSNISFCHKCKTQYKSLNSHFTSMLDQTSSKVCMDIVDMMNYTRLKWSKDLHCSHRSGTVAPVLVITTVICAMPVIFYVANRLIRPSRERTIVVRRKMKFPQNKYGSMNASQQTFVSSNSQNTDAVSNYR